VLLPAIDDDSREFWAGCAAGELRLPRCNACGHRQFPPRPMCPACAAIDQGWEVMSGRGEIWSFVVAHPPLLAAYAEQAPYNVIVVALHEDPTLRLVGNLVASADGPIGEIDPTTIEIGEPVRVVFTPIGDDDEVGTIALPRWIRI
jgi:uncharacterized OB-fold protein